MTKPKNQITTNLKNANSDNNQKHLLWQNSKRQFWTHLKNSNYDQTKKSKCDKTQVRTKLSISNYDKTQSFKLRQNSKTSIFIKKTKEKIF